MPRIPDEEMARLKAVPLVDLCRDYGIELKSQGKDLAGKCPFHEDDSPSFIVSPGKNLWNCLGACGCGGDTIQLVMKKEGITFRHACEKLRTRAGTGPRVPVFTPKERLDEEPLVSREESRDHPKLLHAVVEYYNRTFMNDPAAMKYLQARQCFSPEAVTYFKLGYANRSIGYQLPQGGTDRAIVRRQLTQLGILREKTGHEHLSGCVTIPIFDEKGEVVQIYGRRLSPTTDTRHLYLQGKQRGVWNRDGLLPGEDWYLCEALLDALTLWSHGIKATTASYGVHGFTQEHLALILERKPGRVILCYDADPAGDAQAWSLACELTRHGVSVWRAAIPNTKDINDVAREAADSGAALRAVLDRAMCMTEAAKKRMKAELPVAPESPTRAPSSLAANIAAVAAKKEASDGLALTVEKKDADEIVLRIADRCYRVRGLYKNTGYETLKVSLRLGVGRVGVDHAQPGAGAPAGSGAEPLWHLDTLDLAQAKQRVAFVMAASEETGVKPEVLKRDIGRVLLKLEEMQEERLRSQVAAEPERPKMSEDDRRMAMHWLCAPDLLDRIVGDMAACGIVGEEKNKLVGYLAAVSRKLAQPLAVVVQSTSAAGKTALMEAVLAFMPPEERIKYSALTGQALFYLSDTDLRHKILAVVEEEGAERASYALKLLQSEGELTIAATGKDPQTGRMVTQEYRVEGPVMIFLTTTAVDIDEELLNRCLVLTVDEGREQTAAIHRLQRKRETLDGLMAQEVKTLLTNVHRNAQRLLRPLHVVNPYAEKLTFLDDRTRTRRDHMKYLALIRVITFLHQYQRTVHEVEQDGKVLEYIETTLSDIEAANALAHHVLGRCLDEMPPQTRRLLEIVERMVTERCGSQKIERMDVRFRARELREYCGWGNTQLHLHLSRLVELEYVLTHRADHGQGFVYELVYDGGGKDGGRFLPGLLDVESLRRGGSAATPRDAGASPGAGASPCRPGSIRGASGPVPWGVPSPERGLFPSETPGATGEAPEKSA